MARELNFTVSWQAYNPSETDAFGNAVDAWSTATDVLVYGYSTAGTAEQFERGRNPVEWDLEVFAPTTWTPSARDKVTVDGDTFMVDGEPFDYSHGPYGRSYGSVVKLKRVEG